MGGKFSSMFKTDFTRRGFLAAGGSGLGLWLLDRSADGYDRSGPQDKPNIVFILADDLGYADVSCYGRAGYKTPAIDRLAVQGVRFSQAYANSAVCSATRVGLITGRYQNRLPIGPQDRVARRRPACSGHRPLAGPSPRRHGE
jgi:hypothetical protein